MSDSTYYTLAEAAGMLKVHVQTVRRWIREDRLSAVRVGRQLRVRPADILTMTQPVGPRNHRGSEDDGIADMDLASLSAMGDLWDNEEDAAYDEWERHYDVEPARE